MPRLNRHETWDLEDLIPPGFVCPICKHARYAISQWARDRDGYAICRSCLGANRALLISPLASRVPLMHPSRVRPANPGDVAGPATCDAGLCVVCKSETTRRHLGYCSACARSLAFEEHEAGKTYRLDQDGCCFFPARVRRKGKVRFEARYPWGEEALPMRKSARCPEGRAFFDLQQERMWEVVMTHYSDVARVVSFLVSGNLDECDRVLHDAGLKAACRASLRAFVGVGERDTRQYVLRSVRRDVMKLLERERSTSKREIDYDLMDEAELANATTVDPLEYASPFMREQLSAELDPVRQLNELGLTEFERSILWSRYVDGLTLEQIGEKHGVVKSTVGGWIRRILQKVGAKET